MTRTRVATEHNIAGIITHKEEVRNYQGRNKGKSYYKLFIEATKSSKPEIWGGFIQAWREKILDDQTWDDILTDKYLNKKYLLTCHRHGYIYKLIKWKETK